MRRFRRAERSPDAERRARRSTTWLAATGREPSGSVRDTHPTRTKQSATETDSTASARRTQASVREEVATETFSTRKASGMSPTLSGGLATDCPIDRDRFRREADSRRCLRNRWRPSSNCPVRNTNCCPALDGSEDDEVGPVRIPPRAWDEQFHHCGSA